SMLASFDEDPANLEKYAAVYKNTYLRLGAFFMNNDDKDQARAYFNKALEIDPENEAIKDLIKKLDK
ncbi:MAG: tetratricopeptide repeat protein, partial [Duncaniella sp.]|nr:tetratricopeptide repeat protein [Duncaniella sp.]